MAIDNMGNMSGSLGNLVHYRLKGKQVVRHKPAHMTNPKTVGQRNHRMKIKLASRFVKSIYNFIKIGYQATSLDNPSNEARQYLIKNCFIVTTDSISFDYPSVLISRGGIKKPEDFSMTFDGNTAHITWKRPVKGDYTDGADRVMITLFSDEGLEGLSWLLSNAVTRQDGSALITVPIHSKPVHIWMFYYNSEKAVGEDRKKVSDSVYLGVIE